MPSSSPVVKEHLTVSIVYPLKREKGRKESMNGSDPLVGELSFGLEQGIRI